MKDGTYLKTETGLEEITIDYGYWVASNEIDPNEIRPREYLGVWTDPETGKTWYDQTHFIEDLGTALTLCRVWNQKAIWDNANKVAIPMNPAY
jgi:hypothetical protein